MKNISSPEIAAILKKGGIVVAPTDTLYGVLGSALNKETVARIYRLRKRNTKKPMIILIGSLRDLSTFGIVPIERTRRILKRLWPGKVSVIFPITKKASRARFSYLHRGTNTLAFRLPRSKRLRALLQKTGPLVAPSANPEGLSPATTIQKAKRYFGGRVDAYIDGGTIVSRPSTLVTLRNETITVTRKGAVKIPKRFLR